MSVMVSEVAAVVRRLPDAFADSCDRWLLRLHRPEQVFPTDAPYPENLPWCLHDQVRWPCDTAMRAADRIAARAI